MTVTQFSLGIASHNNHYLFSDHYLNVLLKQDARWCDVETESADFATWLLDLYAKERDQLSKYSESQLEEHWFKPIFTRLGHVYEIQGQIAEGLKPSDYVFFATDTTRQQAITKGVINTRQATAIGEVKKWGVPLGKKLPRGKPTFADNNPSFQIDTYLRTSDVKWGILSNGRYFRLVHLNTSYKLDIYFEIDLEKAINSLARKADINFFWLFFQAGSFQPDANGRVFLEDALTASLQYACALENDLSENAYRALEHLIQGFTALENNAITPDELPTVYENSLYLLYRLIFLFYAESRRLMPMENKLYSRYSLTRLSRQIADELDAGEEYASDVTRYWCALRDLFLFVSDTHSEAHRGLFNDALHPFLAKKEVGDSYLVAAIDILARREVNGKRENVDYRTLNERQIGSIYEGLLAYQPRLATEPMVAVRTKNVEVWQPASQKHRQRDVVDRREIGQIYLVTDKGARKSTGSYYTPDYIVKYMVETTLQPVIDQAREQIKAQAKASNGENDTVAQRFAQAVLQIRVLDPAMGSGHFLVEATDFLAKAIATDAYVPTDVQTQDDDLVYWRRRVVEHCIYGVDKNSMAVELAKLSLWLKTMAAERPLSFLDHHLRHGDALVGATLEQLNGLPSPKQKADANQPSLLNETQLSQDLFKAVGGVALIQNTLSDSLEAVHDKERILKELQSHLTRWRRMADVWVSAFFGNDSLDTPIYRDVVAHLQGKEVSTPPAQLDAVLQHPSVTQQDYFHWPLEFPEIFFNSQGQPLGDHAGFDVVIGNPPWIDNLEFSSSAKPFQKQNFQTAKQKYDQYGLFIELGVKLLKSTGFVEFIVQNKFLVTDYGLTLREYIIENVNIHQIIDLNGSDIFQNTSTYPLIIKLSKQNTKFVSVGRLSEPLSYMDIEKLFVSKGVNKISFNVPSQTFGSKNWRLTNIEETDVWKKLETSVNHIKLSAVIDGFSKGAVTCLNDAYIFPMNATPKVEQRLLRKRGTAHHIDRYHVNDFSELIIFPHEKDGLQKWSPINLAEYPLAKSYFDSCYQELSQRRFFGKNVTEVGKDFFEIIHIPEMLSGTTLVFPKVCNRPEFAFNNFPDVLWTQPAYLMFLGENLNVYFLLSILNSSLIMKYLRTISPTLRGGYMELKTQEIGNIPIPLVDVTKRQVDVQTAVSHYTNRNHTALLDEVGTNPILLHDMLAFLAKKMTTMHQERAQQVERFWDDLEGVVLDEKTSETLRTKGKWEQTVHKKIPSAQSFVDPESRSSITLDLSLGWNETAFKGLVKLIAGRVKGLSDIVNVYRDYAPTYTGLSQQIKETDALIDQLVYRLYGLTPEEIRLVESA